MPHGSIVKFSIVPAQKIRLNSAYENNPPDGFLLYRKRLHPPPEGFFLLGGGITFLPDVVAIFLHKFWHPSQKRYYFHF